MVSNYLVHLKQMNNSNSSLLHKCMYVTSILSQYLECRGGSRISGKGVLMYKGVGG